MPDLPQGTLPSAVFPGLGPDLLQGTLPCWVPSSKCQNFPRGSCLLRYPQVSGQTFLRGPYPALHTQPLGQALPRVLALSRRVPRSLTRPSAGDPAFRCVPSHGPGLPQGTLPCAAASPTHRVRPSSRDPALRVSSAHGARLSLSGTSQRNVWVRDPVMHLAPLSALAGPAPNHQLLSPGTLTSARDAATGPGPEQPPAGRRRTHL